ncbi:glycosyltransferase [Frankia sp. Cppng1_Ct_nod]|uniref:glycosyltransferase family 2 protein n=1 Tax=Frankia sp. Cppng1_Ct_nod TaxID=2897162 RepID=UPI0013EF7EEA|nr:glycosyltransferase [Frankia sp. Cppng1_Ct_nod]
MSKLHPRAEKPRPLPTDRLPPQVSVFISCYNYGRFLADSVHSVLSQGGVRVNVVIIDDASTDGSQDIAAALAAADPRVSLIAHERNHGHLATFNEGLGLLTGTYAVKLDADDMLTPGSLSRAAALAEHHPTVGFVYGFPAQFRTIPTPRARTEARRWLIWRGDEWIARMCHRGHNTIMQPEVLMRTETLRRVGEYNTDLPHSHDMELWLRFATVSDIGWVGGADQGFYRIHPDSMQRTVNAGLMIDLQGRRDAYESVLTGAGKEIPDAADLLRTARRKLASEALDHACRTFDDAEFADQSVDAYVDFAIDTFPEARQTRAWASLERRRWMAADPPARRALARAASEAARDMEGRIRWRRWRWSGV